jgi:Cellulose biosynthesis protein BcsS
MLLALVLTVAPARAELPSPFMSRAVEMWSGAEATRHAWSSWAGVNWSPFGTVDRDGFRVRLGGGGGQYRYSGSIDGVPQSIYGSSAFADLLVGYQMGLGSVTVKAFAGAAFDGHLLDPFDERNPVNAAATGAKGVLEAWVNLSLATFAQVDLGYTTAHDTYSSRVRLGYRLTDELSLGLEGGAFGNAASDNLKAGVFARYAWYGGEISASGGVSGDIAARQNPYGSLVYLKRF